MLRITFGRVILALALAEVTAWTIDLPEARKFLFEKNDRLEKSRHEQRHAEGHAETHPNAEQALFSNRRDSNSGHHEARPHEARHHEARPHEARHHEARHYARDFAYHSYFEKEARRGSGGYLEGLRRSVELFESRLRNCSANDTSLTNARYYFNETAFNATAFNETSLTGPALPTSSTPPPWRPANESPPSSDSASASGRRREECRRMTRASEHVRRLAQLAAKTASELQDLAYSRKYMKEDPHELSKAENELILKLAWLLDRLAYYTDYRPQPHRDFNHDYASSSTTLAPPVVNLLNASEETKLMMMNCLKQKSDVPATVRCAYPQEIPGAVQFLINNPNPAPGGVPAGSSRVERVSSPPQPPSQELLVAAELRHHQRQRRTPAARLASEPHASSKRTKRAAEHPAVTFMKYFVKHKIWEADNPAARSESPSADRDQLPVGNHLPHAMRKRAADGARPHVPEDHFHAMRKRAADGARPHVPEDPFQDLSKYVKHKKGVHFVKDETQAQRIRAFVDKIRNSKPSTAKAHARRIAKLFRSKRSHAYESDVDRPRAPDDLFQDLGYYAKNKPGTSRNRAPAQAAQVRAGLAQIFANPNIETVRRFGSNYNPLVPDPLVFAALRSAADN